MKKKSILLSCLVLVVAMLLALVAESGYYFTRGFIAFRNGFEGESVRYLGKSIKANPNFIEAYMLLALAYAEWGSASLHYMEHDDEGLAKLKSETFGRAENILKAALVKFPYHHFRDDIQYMLGRMYDEDSRNTGYVWDKNKAVQYYEQFISKYPNNRYAQKARKHIEALSR